MSGAKYQQISKSSFRRLYKAFYEAVSRCMPFFLITLLLSLLLFGNLALAAGNLSVTRQYSPSAEAAVTVSAGDDDGFEKTPTNAYADDTSYANDANSGLDVNSDATGSGTDKHDYYTYGMGGVPSGSTIHGITVRADIIVDRTDQGAFTAIRLSWDGGTNWTAVKQQTITSTTETTYTYGGSSDTWGRTWETSELSDANFRVQVINGDTDDLDSRTDFDLDWIPVSITFTAPWDSYEDTPPTTIRDTFNSSYQTVYMKGTGFAIGSYNVGYYDATVSGGGNWQANDGPISVDVDGILNSAYSLNTDPNAVAGTWHALVQPASGYTAFSTDSNYDTVVGDPDTYGLIGNDSFTVEQSAIPEFPTVMAGIVTAGMCIGIYYWMKRRRLAACQSSESSTSLR